MGTSVVSNAFAAVTPGRVKPVGGDKADPIGTRPSRFARTPIGANLYVETAGDAGEWELARLADWENITLSLDGADDKATIVVRALDASKLTKGGSIGDEHFQHLLDELQPDRRVRIAIPRGADPPVVLFQGYPQSRGVSWSEGHQTINVAAISEGQERLRHEPAAQIIGRTMRKSPTDDPEADPQRAAENLLQIEALPTVFNPKGKPNKLRRFDYRKKNASGLWENASLDQMVRIPAASGEGDHAIYVFGDDASPGQTPWNFAEAIRYVAALYAQHCGVNVDALMDDTVDFLDHGPGEDSHDPFEQRMLARPDNVSIHSMNASEALTALCHAAGLHWHVLPKTDEEGAFTWSLRVFAAIEDVAQETEARQLQMGAPVLRDIPRDRPFSDYAGLRAGDVAKRNEARQASLSIDARAISAATFVGGPMDYECTLLLRPGWLPHPQLDEIGKDAPLGEAGQEEREDAAEAAAEYWDAQLLDEARDPEMHLPISVYHVQHPDHHVVENSKVFRLWVFPDSHEYLSADGTTYESPYARAIEPWSSPSFYDPYTQDGKHLIYVDGAIGGGISQEVVEKWTLRRRPFGPLIGRRSGVDTARDPIVLFNFKDTDPLEALTHTDHWLVYQGQAVFDKERAALWISDDNPMRNPTCFAEPDDPQTSMIYAMIGMDFETGEYVAPHFFVAVVCTVRGDRRLSYAPLTPQASFTRTRAAVVDTGMETFTYRDRRNQNSLLNVRALDPSLEFEGRDDRGRFADYAQRQAERMVRDTIGGSFETPYVKTEFQLGDSFSGVAGLGISFRSYPEITGIEYVKDPHAGFRTIYHLSDLRDSPETGSE